MALFGVVGGTTTGAFSGQQAAGKDAAGDLAPRRAGEVSPVLAAWSQLSTEAARSGTDASAPSKPQQISTFGHLLGGLTGGLRRQRSHEQAAKGYPAVTVIAERLGMERVPNQRLMAARLAAGLTQEQLAELGNLEVERATSRIGAMDADYISKLERGVITWPGKRYRQAMCMVLGVASERDLGFRCTRGRRVTVESDQSGVGRRTDKVRRADFLRLTGVAAATLATPSVFNNDAVRTVDERECAEWLAWELWQRKTSAIHVSELPLSIARYLGALDAIGRVNVGQMSMSPQGFIVGDADGYFSFTQSSLIDFFVGQRIFGSMVGGKSQLLATASNDARHRPCYPNLCPAS
jgi:transcriptional regulator with XRE-family HTH domain